MAERNLMDLLHEIFTPLPRQAPAAPEHTRRALAAFTNLPPAPRILDLGCGQGHSALELARATGGTVLAVDVHPPFLDALRRKAEALGLADRVTALQADMTSLELPTQSADLVWSEGAIFLMGLERGLRAWREYLVPGGGLAFTDVVRLVPELPAEAAAFWQKEYPALRDVEGNLAAVRQAGYEVLDHFTLPDAAWWDEYYIPLEARLPAFREKYAGDPQALEFIETVQAEIDMRRKYGDSYGYEFIMGIKTDA